MLQMWQRSVEHACTRCISHRDHAHAGQYVGAVVVLDVEDMKECDLIHPVDGLRVPVRVKALIAGSWSWRTVGCIWVVSGIGGGCGVRVVQVPAGWVHRLQWCGVALMLTCRRTHVCLRRRS